jgi:hypothetical protein
MTLSNGQALAGAHIPALVPLRETVKLPDVGHGVLTSSSADGATWEFPVAWVRAERDRAAWPLRDHPPCMR